MNRLYLRKPESLQTTAIHSDLLERYENQLLCFQIAHMLKNDKMTFTFKTITDNLPGYTLLQFANFPLFIIWFMFYIDI